MPEWGRILTGGIGCFLLALAALALNSAGVLLWLADALLIFLVLDRPSRSLAMILAAGATGIALAWMAFPETSVTQGLFLALGSVLHAASAQYLLRRFSPTAVRLDTARSLAHLLLWCALLSPITGAVIMAVSLAPVGWAAAAHGFVSWWLASAVGTAMLLPFLLSLAHSRPGDLRRLRSRAWEALLVAALLGLLAAAGRQLSGELALLLGLPPVLWAALRVDFRSTALLCLILELLPVVGMALRIWPLELVTSDVVSSLQAQQIQLYVLAITLPALFASLLTQEQRSADVARVTALKALRAVMDAVPAAIITLTPGGKIGLWSRGAERIFGWKRQEAEGRDAPYLSPDNAAQAASLRQRVLSGNEIQNLPIQRREKSGTVLDLVVNAVPQRDAEGNISGIISVMDDVTDRRRLESSREEHRARLAAILDAVADPIITIDEVGHITSFSRAAETVFGYRAAEVMGRKLNILMPEPYHGRHDAYLRRYRETGEARLIGSSREVMAKRKDGSTFPAEITVSEAWLNDRRIFAGIVRDLSTRRAPVVHRQEAGDFDKAKFLSKIAHDLRQPLHALSLMAGALERRVDDPEVRELVDHLTNIVRSTQATFENSIEWARLENGLVGTASSTVAANEILATAARDFAPEAERRGLQFRRVPSRAMLECDPALLLRVLRQLLDNAMKYTAAGKILLGARRHGTKLRLIVADTGVGIPPDQQDIVFEPYAQLDPGRDAGGLGLGLAIAARLAALGGLKIDVRSVSGRGSQFWVEVPLVGG